MCKTEIKNMSSTSYRINICIIGYGRRLKKQLTRRRSLKTLLILQLSYKIIEQELKNNKNFRIFNFLIKLLENSVRIFFNTIFYENGKLINLIK